MQCYVHKRDLYLRDHEMKSMKKLQADFLIHSDFIDVVKMCIEQSNNNTHQDGSSSETQPAELQIFISKKDGIQAGMLSASALLPVLSFSVVCRVTP